MLHFSRWKSILIWMTVLASVLIVLPNVIGDRQLPDWIVARKLALGLDLQGGSHFLFKVERGDITERRLKGAIGEIGQRLRDGGIGYMGLSGSGRTLQVRIGDPGKRDEAKKVLAPLTEPVVIGAASEAVSELTMQDAGDGVLRFTISAESIERRLADAVSQSMEVARRRLVALSPAEPVVRKRADDRIVVQVPGSTDPQEAKEILDQTAFLSFHLVDPSMSVEDAVNDAPPATAEVVYSIDDPPTAYLVEKRALIDGSSIATAQAEPDPDPGTDEAVVNIRFDAAGTLAFSQATGGNGGRTLAVVLDNQIISTSVIDEPVTDGAFRIAGGFSPEGAANLAALLTAGAFPAELTVVEERSIGSALGDASIRSGIQAGLIGAALVCFLMLFFYGFFGALANIAVLVNVVMIIALLSLFGAALSLPGIAGIVLTIGMAVDSNVLIYERIREEVRAGRPLAEALPVGFSRAFATVLDANVTTLIAALVLAYLGSGPVRGFAVTVAFGVITTLFTAYTLTRWMMSAWFHRFRPKALPKGIRTGLFDGTSIRFMSFRRYTFLLTMILVAGTFALLATRGVNFGIDFRGGSVVEVRARAGDADLQDLRFRLGELNLGEVVATRNGPPSDVLIRIPPQGGGENAEQSAIIKVRGELQSEYDFRRVEVVGPSVSGDISWAATFGVLVALAVIVVYIWVRFKWQFALGAIIAALHDIILTLGFFAITGFEFSLASIAAVLTVIGYSLNDTVVVYDRIREDLKKYPRMPMRVLIDESINGTLSRTILTGTTTALALASLTIFGGETIRSFAAPMLFGVAVGTFSSIYIAGPILILFGLRRHVTPSEDGRPGLSSVNGAA